MRPGIACTDLRREMNIFLSILWLLLANTSQKDSPLSRERVRNGTYNRLERQSVGNVLDNEFMGSLGRLTIVSDA